MIVYQNPVRVVLCFLLMFSVVLTQAWDSCEQVHVVCVNETVNFADALSLVQNDVNVRTILVNRDVRIDSYSPLLLTWDCNSTHPCQILPHPSFPRPFVKFELRNVKFDVDGSFWRISNNGNVYFHFVYSKQSTNGYLFDINGNTEESKGKLLFENFLLSMEKSGNSFGDSNRGACFRIYCTGSFCDDEDFDDIVIRNIDIDRSAHYNSFVYTNIYTTACSTTKVDISNIDINIAKTPEFIVFYAYPCCNCTLRDMDISEIGGWYSTSYPFSPIVIKSDGVHNRNKVLIQNVKFHMYGFQRMAFMTMRASNYGISLNVEVNNCDIRGSKHVDVIFVEDQSGGMKLSVKNSVLMNTRFDVATSCGAPVVFENNVIVMGLPGKDIYYDFGTSCHQTAPPGFNCSGVGVVSDERLDACVCDGHFYGDRCENCPENAEADCMSCKNFWSGPLCDYCHPNFYTGVNCDEEKVCNEPSGCPCMGEEVCVDDDHFRSLQEAFDYMSFGLSFKRVYLGKSFSVHFDDDNYEEGYFPETGIAAGAAIGTEDEPIVIMPSPYVEHKFGSVGISCGNIISCLSLSSPYWKIQSSDDTRLVFSVLYYDFDVSHAVFIPEVTRGRVHIDNVDWYPLNSYGKFVVAECYSSCDGASFSGTVIENVKVYGEKDNGEYHKVLKVNIHSLAIDDEPKIMVSNIIYAGSEDGYFDREQDGMFRCGDTWHYIYDGDQEYSYHTSGKPFIRFEDMDLSGVGEGNNGWDGGLFDFGGCKGGRFEFSNIYYTGKPEKQTELSLVAIDADAGPVELLLEDISVSIDSDATDDFYYLWVEIGDAPPDIEIRGLYAVNAEIYIEGCNSLVWDKNNEIYSTKEGTPVGDLIDISTTECPDWVEINVCDEGFCKGYSSCSGFYPNHCECRDTIWWDGETKTSHWFGRDCGSCPPYADPVKNCTCKNRWTGEFCDDCPSTPPDNWDPFQDCAKCRNAYQENTTTGNCDICPGNWDPSDDCGSCLGKWGGADCDQCPTNGNVTDSCMTCKFNWGGDDCTVCPNPVGYDDNCDQCATGWEGTSCQTCTAGAGLCPCVIDGTAYPEVNQTDGCATCKTDPLGRKNYPDCDSCIAYWVGFNNGTACDTCPGIYEQTNCDACGDNDKKDPDNHCLTCLNDPHGHKTSDCSSCKNSFEDYANGCWYCPPLFEPESCDRCKNSFHEWELDPDEKCMICTNNSLGRRSYPECVCEHYWDGDECNECDDLIEDIECNACINALQDISTMCSSCLNDPYGRKNYPTCDRCLDYWTEADCSECPESYVNTTCAECINPLQDKTNECGSCAEVGHWSFPNCSFCEELWGGGDCLSCQNHLHDEEEDCDKCLNDTQARKNYPNCTECEGYWTLESGCLICPDHYKQANCDECAWEKADPEKGCLVCIGSFSNFPDCTQAQIEETEIQLIPGNETEGETEEEESEEETEVDEETEEKSNPQAISAGATAAIVLGWVFVGILGIVVLVMVVVVILIVVLTRTRRKMKVMPAVTDNVQEEKDVEMNELKESEMNEQKESELDEQKVEG